MTRRVAHPAALQPHHYALCDFQFFIENYCGRKLWECQKRWAAAVQLVEESEQYDGLLLLAPADHGKTSSIVSPLISWLHARDHNMRVILAGNKDEYAEQIGRSWARRIDRIKDFRTKFGLQRGDRWTGGEYVIERPNMEDKDPSLLCVGVGSEIQSQRADRLVFDDIATRKNSATVAQREKIASWVMTDARSRLDRAGPRGHKWFIFAHRVEAQDAYTLFENKDRWLVIKDRAIVDDAAMTVLAPEAHTYDELAEHRADDPVGFALLYQQQPVATGIYTTRAQVAQVKNKELVLMHRLDEGTRAKYDYVVMSCDPAFSTSRFARYAVFGIWGVRGRKLTLLYGLRERTSPEQLLEILKAKIRIYNPDRVFVEANVGQALIIPVLRREFPHMAERINGTYTLNPKGELDAEFAIMFQSIGANPPLLELPYGDAGSQSFTDAFEEELVNYPNYRYRDVMMMWYIALKGMNLIKSEERRGFIRGQGVVGSVSNRIKDYHGVDR